MSRATGAPPLRVLFFLLHPGYLRYFEPLAVELARRGHSIHIAFAQPARDPADALLADRLRATLPNLTTGEAPARPETDGWRPIAALVRSAMDVVRFTAPRFDDAPALRARATDRLLEQVLTARIDPFTRRVARLLVERFARPRSEARTSALLTLLTRLERRIPTSPEIDAFVARHAPDVVLASPVVEFGSPQIEAVKSGLRAGIPTGIAVASWDNLTTKGHLRVIPHRVFVWNEEQRREAIEDHGVPDDIVVATGSQKFDEWFTRTPSIPGEAFSRQVGLDPTRPFVLYLCSSGFIAPHEVPFVRDWVSWLRSATDPGVRSLGILVRPHPQNAAQWEGVELGDNARVRPQGGAQPDDGAARAEFFDALSYAAAVVGVNTSALIEAGIAGRTVLSIADDRFAATQEGTIHFRYLLAENGGFVQLARSAADHVAQLAETLRSADRNAGATRAFVERFVRPHGLDRPATPFLADAIEDLARQRPAPWRRLRPGPLRAVLGVAALTARVVSQAGRRAASHR